MSRAEKRLIDALLLGKPYFGTAMRALQGPVKRHAYLQAIAREAAATSKRGDVRVLEIGSWVGASAITWASSLQKFGVKGTVTCVDAWEPYFDLDIDGEFHYREMRAGGGTTNSLNFF